MRVGEVTNKLIIGGLYIMTSVGKAMICVKKKSALRNFTDFNTNCGHSKYYLWT